MEKEWKEYIPKEYWDFEDVFTEPTKLPPSRPYDFTLELKEGATLPKSQKCYPLSRAELDFSGGRYPKPRFRAIHTYLCSGHFILMKCKSVVSKSRN